MLCASRFAARAVVWILVGVLASAAGRVAVAQEATADPPEPTAPEIDPEAMATLLRSAEFLAGAKRFHYVTQVEWDVLQPSGQLLEFGARRVVSIRRPDRLRVEAENRDGNRTLVLFDAKTITMLDRDENVYARAERPGKLDDMLDFTLKELETPLPLAELLYSSFPDIVRARVRGIYSVGEELVAGTPCEHLAVIGEEVDAQFWIATGKEPLPRRIVLSYKQAEGNPQFRADFIQWNLAPKEPDTIFAFEPPAGAEAIPFLLHAREAAPAPQTKGDSR